VDNLAIGANTTLGSVSVPLIRTAELLALVDLPVLTAADFDSVQTLTSLIISGNDSLVDLPAFPVLDAIDTLIVSDNPQLSQCSVDVLVALSGRCADCDGNLDETCDTTAGP
jgi:hypothetical protein